MSRLLGSLCVALVLAAGSAGTASAHAALRHAHPSAGEELAVAPEQISIEYSTGVDLTQAEIHLTDASGAEIALARVEVEAAAGETLVRRIAGTLAPGTYKVRWRVLSIDGHWTRGDYTFVVTVGVSVPGPRASPPALHGVGGWRQKSRRGRRRSQDLRFVPRVPCLQNLAKHAIEVPMSTMNR